jgi:hypothetical protein
VDTFDYVFLGIILAMYLFVFCLLAYIVPIFGVTLILGGLGGYLYSKPEWISKFWNQKEYRE